LDNAQGKAADQAAKAEKATDTGSGTLAAQNCPSLTRILIDITVIVGGRWGSCIVGALHQAVDGSSGCSNCKCENSEDILDEHLEVLTEVLEDQKGGVVYQKSVSGNFEFKLLIEPG
jgi:hypothetical protein